MPSWEEIYKMATDILLKSAERSARREGDVFIISEYKDKKIIIAGQWPIRDRSADVNFFDEVWIALRTEPENSISQPFPPLMKLPEETTLVFKYRYGIVTYYRKGVWPRYVQKVFNSIGTEKNAFLHEKDVDDEDFFRDVLP